MEPLRISMEDEPAATAADSIDIRRTVMRHTFWLMGYITVLCAASLTIAKLWF